MPSKKPPHVQWAPHGKLSHAIFQLQRKKKKKKSGPTLQQRKEKKKEKEKEKKKVEVYEWGFSNSLVNSGRPTLTGEKGKSGRVGVGPINWRARLDSFQI